MKKILSVFFVMCLFLGSAEAAPVLAGERSRNLKTLDASPLLFEFHRFTTTDSKQRFYFPQRDSSWRRQYAEKEKDALLKFNHAKASIAASLIAGTDYRGGESLGDTIFPAADGGVYLRGFIDSLEFMLDARIYVESHSAERPVSFDGEFVEFQRFSVLSICPFEKEQAISLISKIDYDETIKQN